MRLGQELIESLKEAMAGDFARVTIDGVTWARTDRLTAVKEIERLKKEGLEDYRALIADNANLLSQNETLEARIAELERDIAIAQGNTDAAIEDYNDALARIKELESER